MLDELLGRMASRLGWVEPQRRSPSSFSARTPVPPGRVEDAQHLAYLTYAERARHTMIDQELYLPWSWISDLARCTTGGIPEEVKFATKPVLVRAMITRVLDAGAPSR